MRSDISNLPSDPDQLITLRQCQEALKQILEPITVKQIGHFRRTGDKAEIHPENHPPIVPPTDVHEEWLWFLQEVALVNCQGSLAAAEAPAAMDRISGLFTSALLYVKLASILDEALEQYISLNRSALPGAYKGDLNGRLKHLEKHGVLRDTAPLHRVRSKRNAIGHQPTTPANWQSQQVTWQELNEAIDDTEAALQQLGLVGARPAYQPFATRVPEAVPPDKPDVYMSHTYCYGLKLAGSILIQFSHAVDYYRPSATQR